MSCASDFTDFSLTGNVMDMADGVTFGAGLGNIVGWAVTALITPVVNAKREETA